MQVSRLMENGYLSVKIVLIMISVVEVEEQAEGEGGLLVVVVAGWVPVFRIMVPVIGVEVGVGVKVKAREALFRCFCNGVVYYPSQLLVFIPSFFFVFRVNICLFFFSHLALF